ncbi:MAG: hypothetical protein V4760_17545 [Bdellovibrionota bacterium]
MPFLPFIQRVSQRSWRCVSFVLVLTLLSGCPNSFGEFANKTSDEALLFQSQLYADTRDWDNAITTIGRMTTAGKADRTAKYLLSSYYAGRCGLDLLELADALGNLGTTQLYPFLLSTYAANTATDLADCQSAETTLLSISPTYASLTPDENVLLALVEFAKIGSLLAANTLVDAANDGTYDGDVVSGGSSLDPCDSTHITDLEIGKLGTGLIIAVNALSASGSAISASMGSAGSLTSAYGDEQDPTAFSALEIKGLRGFIKSNEVGFNSCGGDASSGVSCLCP